MMIRRASGGSAVEPAGQRRRLDEEHLAAAHVALAPGRRARTDARRSWRANAREHVARGRASAPGLALDDAERRDVIAGVGAERRLPHAVLRQRLQVDVDDDLRAAEREALASRRRAGRARRPGRARPRRDRRSTRRSPRRCTSAPRGCAPTSRAPAPAGTPTCATVMFDAERLASTVAPASAASVPGGTGTQRSSQMSVCRTKPGRCGSAHQHVGAERHVGAEQRERCAARALGGGTEPAQLVELAVVRRIRLRRDRQRAAAIERHRAIEQQPVHRQRHARRRRTMFQSALACATCARAPRATPASSDSWKNRSPQV